MKTKNAQTLSVHLDNDIVAMLARRAAARGVSKSKYAAMVFAKWRDEKYPALDTVDSTARAVVLQELADEKSRAKNPQEIKDDTAAALRKNRHEANVEAGKGEVIAFGRSLEGKASRKRKASA